MRDEQLEQRLSALEAEVKGGFNSILDILKGQGESTGLIGRVEKLESGESLTVAKIKAAASVSVAKVAVLAAVAGGVAGGIPAILILVLT